MKIFITIMFILISLTFISCNYFRMSFTDTKLKVVNHSAIDIGVLINLSYPDTTIENTHAFLIHANDSDRVELLNKYWDNILKENRIITLFFVEWKYIERNQADNKETNPILKKMTLSKEDIDSLNWIISFP